MDMTRKVRNKALEHRNLTLRGDNLFKETNDITDY